MQHQYFALIDAAVGALDSRDVNLIRGFFLADIERALTTMPVDISVISSFFDADVDSEHLKMHVSMFHDLLQQKETAAT